MKRVNKTEERIVKIGTQPYVQTMTYKNQKDQKELQGIYLGISFFHIPLDFNDITNFAIHEWNYCGCPGHAYAKGTHHQLLLSCHFIFQFTGNGKRN